MSVACQIELSQANPALCRCDWRGILLLQGRKGINTSKSSRLGLFYAYELTICSLYTAALVPVTHDVLTNLKLRRQLLANSKHAGRAWMVQDLTQWYMQAISMG